MILDLSCRSCGAKTDEPCKTPGGRKRDHHHRERVEDQKLRALELERLREWNAACHPEEKA